MIWSTDDARRATRIYARLAIDHVYENDERAKEYAKYRLAQMVISMGRMYALDLLDQDVYQWERPDGPFGMAMMARWLPDCPVELLGGPNDGRRVRIPRERIGEPWRVPEEPRRLMFDPNPSMFPEPLGITMYERVGWNDDARVWIYKADAKHSERI